MRRRCVGWLGAAVVATVTTAARAADPADLVGFHALTVPVDGPLLMAAGAAEPPSVYAPPEPERAEDLVNRGGVNVDLHFRYLTDYNYRGVSFNRAVYTPPSNGQAAQGKLHASNFQADGQLTFDLGKLPHPFVAVLANINDSDPLSRFQEIRPSAGLDYTLPPLNVRAGVNAYIYPERERLPGTQSPNTGEAFVQLTLDDSYFFLTDDPILTPYVYAAYDYQLNNGWYLETGFKHAFKFPDQGFSITPYFDVAYVSHFRRVFVAPSGPRTPDTGFQHYDVGLNGELSLNHVLDLPARYGNFSIEGYLTYTGKFSNALVANTEVWGGAGLKYRY